MVPLRITSPLRSPSMESLPSRDRLIELVAEHTCTRNCFGVAGYAASCCKLEKRDFIQGPVRDTAEVLVRLSIRFGREVPFDEVFIGYDEGRARFPERSRWQNEGSYPAIRPLDDEAGGYPCPFLGDGGLCGIYEDRPQMCRDYRCDHLKSVLDLL